MGAGEAAKKWTGWTRWTDLLGRLTLALTRRLGLYLFQSMLST